MMNILFKRTCSFSAYTQQFCQIKLKFSINFFRNYRLSKPSINLTVQTMKSNLCNQYLQSLRHSVRLLFRNATSSPRIYLQGFGACGLGCATYFLISPYFYVHCTGLNEEIAVPSEISEEVITQVIEHEPQFNWHKFYLLLVPQLWYFLSAVVCAIVVAVINIQIPTLLGDIVNILSDIQNRNVDFMQAVADPAYRLVSLYGAQGVFTFVYIYTLSCAGERIAAQLRKDLFQNILRQDIAFFDKKRTGEIISRLTTDVQDFKSSFKQCVSQGLRSVTQATGSIISLYFISPQMTGMMLIIVPTSLVIGTLLGSVLRALSRKVQAQIGKAAAVSEEALGNIRTVRAFAMEEQELKAYSVEVDEARRLSEQLGFGIGIFQAGSNLLLNGIVLGTLFIGGRLMSTSDMTPGQLMSFLVASQTIQRSLSQIFILFGQFVRGMASGARVFEYIDRPSHIPISGGKSIPFHSLKGDIEFRNITFNYPTRKQQEVLSDFNLRIPPGKMVAIVGSSGSGKSTIAALLERFYDLSIGSITIDKVDVKDLDPHWLRSKAIGFINQEPVLFATTIMENIRYGRPGATDQEVIEAATQAHAHEFILHFPHGYKTVVGERGVTVSGGQKQRIAIARALIKNPRILILDEATSALDSESEAIVQKTIDETVKGRTVLVIAHRLSTIRNADVIAVLFNGRIVEMGSHKALLKRKGLYWDLIRKQHSDDKEDDILPQG